MFASLSTFSFIFGDQIFGRSPTVGGVQPAISTKYIKTKFIHGAKKMWSARPKKSNFVRLGRRPRDSRLVTEKNLVAEYRVMSELAAMKKCLPAFVTIEFPSEFLD